MRLTSGSSRSLPLPAAMFRFLTLLLLLVGLVGALGGILGGGVVSAHEGEDDGSSVTLETDPDAPSVEQKAATEHAEGHVLESSWPEDGVMLWVPPKEGRLSFVEPVKASTLTLALIRADAAALLEDEVVRLTSGESVTEILLRLPPIRPGMYELTWSVASVDGTELTGSIGFGLEPPMAAVGGQNHRHGESHLYEDTPGQFSLRLLFLLSVTFLFTAVRRSRLVTGRGILDRVLLRVGAGLLLLATLVTGVVDIANWVDEYHDKPFSAMIAAPGLSLLLPVLAFSVALLVRPRPSSPVFWCGVGVLAAYAGLSHAIRTALGAELFVVFTVLLVAVSLIWAEMLRVLLSPASAADAGPVRMPRVLFGAAGALVVASLLMLFLHAGTLELEMAFARDLRSRVVLSGALLAATGMFSFMAARSRSLRLLALIPGSLVVATSALLAWMPPPAAGL
jgi:methionine-rich copper-binding protein CopC